MYSEPAWWNSGLPLLMERSAGRSDIVVGLIDGPVATDLVALAKARVHRLSNEPDKLFSDSAARRHGTFVAAMLCAARGGAAPGLCPACTFVHFVIFEPGSGDNGVPSADSRLLADGIVECVNAGAEVINMSVAGAPSATTDRRLADALTYAMHRRVLVVAAAGNDGTFASSTITRHPGVVPVVACDREGRPLPSSNLAGSIGRRGIGAPGDRITGLDLDGGTIVRSGTSVAAPFVTGAIALLRSLSPTTPPIEVLAALRRASGRGRRLLMPPLLNASAAMAGLTST